jgi:dTMP kinase
MQNSGVFISLEGIDGCGKTTLKNLLLDQLGDKYPVIGIREPGGTIISEKIRDMLLDIQNDGIMVKTEALLYAAARSQLLEELILPALAQGKIVIADRFSDSTIAYQGYGRGLNLDFLDKLNQLSTGGLKPDLTLLLDIDPRQAWLRRKHDIPDRLEREGLNFQRRIREGYIKLWKKEPMRIKCMDATLSPQELVSKAMQLIEGILGG